MCARAHFCRILSPRLLSGSRIRNGTASEFAKGTCENMGLKGDRGRNARRAAGATPPWLALVVLFLAAAPTLVAAANAPAGLRIDLLEDAEGALSIDQVSASPVQDRFFAGTPEDLNVGFTRSVWWVRLTIANDTDAAEHRYLRQTYPLIDYLDVYARARNGEWHEYSTGDRRVFSSRPVAHRDFIFPLTIPPESERIVYLRYESQGPIDISLALSNSAGLLAALSREQLAYGIYFGCVLMLLVWSGLVFVAVRDNAFFAYFAYVALFGLYMLINNGLAFQYFWPNSPKWGNTSLLVLLHLAAFAALQFSRMILRAADFTPRLDRAAKGLQLVFVTSLLLTPLVDYAQIILPLAFLIMTCVVFMLVLGTVSMISGSRPARFYLLAWSTFLAGSMVFLLKTFGVLPHTFITQHGWQIGSLVEMILLSMTLSSRMNELKHQSRTDSLTLLGNRRLFDDKLRHEVAQAKQLGRSLSLLVLDIDHFKDYNDRHGHVQGDEAIKIVANALRRHTRKRFTACRFGGEEFTVILPGVEESDAAKLAERLRASVQESLEGDRAITISIGYASLSQANFETAEKMLEAADFALYSAKQAGRNRVMGFRGRRSKDLAVTA